MSIERFDIVYMWVDDQWPGYLDQLLRYAQIPHDRNPNRTRNNLDILKFSLRSIEKYAPWRGTVHIVTSRPQYPTWLDRTNSSVRVIHHDEIMPPEILPSFNSFAIQSFLHKIPGLSRRFVSFDDDMLLMKLTAHDDFIQSDGQLLYDFSRPTPYHSSGTSTSPWNAALANNAALLDEIDPAIRRFGYLHGPKMFDIDDCEEIAEYWPDAFEATRRSRFRAHNNIALDALLPQYLVARRRAVAIPKRDTKQRMAYLGLENVGIWNRYWLWRAKTQGVKFLTLNDNFGFKPNLTAVRQVRSMLEDIFPTPSSFEQQQQ